MAALSTTAGAVVYFPLFLRYLYDVLVLGLYCPYLWRCPEGGLRSFYSGHVTAAEERASLSDKAPCRLLDVGVGTGYFLERAPIPAGSEIMLADLNSNCLKTAASRINHAHPEASVRTVIADVLEPDMERSLALSPDRLGGVKFDIVSCMLLLHCLPGPPKRKADAVARLGRHLNTGGKVVGATVLGKGVRHSLVGRFVMFWHNLLGIFDNHFDDLPGLVRLLEARFEDFKWELVETTLLFEASKPKA